ncbi:hypothetical protein [Nocardia sp. NPDC050717]|uniref:hypothetical protein n=1 Tax=Nocardia sp. NPDC050717 TaxID=3157221 RepID=UPI0033C9D6BB
MGWEIEAVDFRYAASECHRIASKIFAQQGQLHRILTSSCVGMAGDYHFTAAWISAYEEACSSWMSTTTLMVEALNHYGDILMANAYNWDVINQTIPHPDRPTPTPSVGNPYAAAHVARGANGDGLQVDGVGPSKVEAIPNGDTSKLLLARCDGWLNCGLNGEVTTAPDGISAISRTFEYSTEDSVNEVRDRLKTLELAATGMVDAAKIVQAAIESYQQKLESLRTTLKQKLESRDSNRVTIFDTFIFLECSAPIFSDDLKEMIYDPVESSEFHLHVSSKPFLKIPDLVPHAQRLKEIAALPIDMEDDSSGSGDGAGDADAVPPPVLTNVSEEYVRRKHYPGGSENAVDKGTFKANEDPYALVDAAKSSPPIPQGDGTYRREVVVPDRYVGNASISEGGGVPTRKYVVIQDRFGTVRTMYPVKEG